jgi:ferritin-like metal-binding protein YciE
MDSLRELFIEQLQDAYDAEKQLIKALPKMAK